MTHLKGLNLPATWTSSQPQQMSASRPNTALHTCTCPADKQTRYWFKAVLLSFEDKCTVSPSVCNSGSSQSFPSFQIAFFFPAHLRTTYSSLFSNLKCTSIAHQHANRDSIDKAGAGHFAVKGENEFDRPLPPLRSDNSEVNWCYQYSSILSSEIRITVLQHSNRSHYRSIKKSNAAKA